MSRTLRTITGACVPLAFVACTSYTPAPLDPADLLQDLRLSTPLVFNAETLGPTEATTAALTHNPELLAIRESVGIADSLLLEAGIWPDINLGWGAMDWIIGGTNDDAITGLSLGVPLFRPDERDALIADAQASRDFVRARLLDAEWRLTRQVQGQYLSLAAAQEHVALAQHAEQIAATTVSFLQRGLEAGAATRFDLEMAMLQAGEVHQRLQSTHREMEIARLQLNALLGTHPNSEYRVPALDVLQSTWAAEALTAQALTEKALAQRPDILESQALYQKAEAALRLEMSKQWPGLEIGTGIAVSLPLFSGFHKRAVKTATLRRDRAATQLKTAVANVRNSAWLIHQEAVGRSQEWASFRDFITPRLESSLRLSEQAQQLGSLSYLEVLFAQRQLNDAQRDSVDVLFAHLRAQADLVWFLGAPITPAGTDQ